MTVAEELRAAARLLREHATDPVFPQLASLLDHAAEEAQDAESLHPALAPYARWQRPLAVARTVTTRFAPEGGL